MGMKDQFQDKAEQLRSRRVSRPARAGSEARERGRSRVSRVNRVSGRERERRSRGGRSRGVRRRDEAQSASRDEQERFDQDYDDLIAAVLSVGCPSSGGRPTFCVWRAFVVGCGPRWGWSRSSPRP